jgi:hypothetical protein
MTSNIRPVGEHCPGFPPLGIGSDRASELIEKLKAEAETEAATEEEKKESALWKSLTKYKSTPTDLEKAHMDIQKIIPYYRQARDEIDGSTFSDFGSLGAIENLLDEVKSCTDGLEEKQKGEVRDLQGKYEKKFEDLNGTLEKAVNGFDQMLSCVKIAEEELLRKKRDFCDLAGAKVGDEELSYCKDEETGKGKSGTAKENALKPPAGAAARIPWWASELVRMFKALGISEEKGKKSSVACESLSVEKIQVYGYSLEIQRVIDKVRSAETTTDAQFKQSLDSAWKEWLNATYWFIKQYLIEKERAEALTKAEDSRADFIRKREEQFVRDALDVEASDDGGCDQTLSS